MALDALTVRLDGGHAAATTIARKRAVFHDALDYAVELGLLPANPVGQVRWTAPKAAAAVNPQTVASPAQVRAILAEVARLRPELTAFFGCLYYAALRCARFPDREFAAISRCFLPVQVLVQDFLWCPIPERGVETSLIIAELDPPRNIIHGGLAAPIGCPVDEPFFSVPFTDSDRALS